MESKEQTEVTRKMGTDSQMESRMAARGGGHEVRGGGLKQKGKKDSWTCKTGW